MAKIGLSKPIIALYSASGSTVTYSSKATLGKFTDLSIDIDDASDNTLYADNAPAEVETSFAGGTVTVTTDDLSPDVMTSVLGLHETTISATGVTTSGAKWLDFDDRQLVPAVALCGVIKRRIGGDTKYQAFVLPKVTFSNPAMAVTTQGETIEWQTQELGGKIERDDTANHGWQHLSSYLATEDEALAAIDDFLGIA